MLRPWVVPILLLVLCFPLPGQQAVVRRDTQFPVELNSTIKTKSAKVGDKVKFRLNEPVLIGNNIVVPEGAKIIGAIEMIQHDAPEEPRSGVRFRISTLEWKRGSAPLNAVVQSVEPSPAQRMAMHPRRRGTLPGPTFLPNIRIRAHIRSHAYTDFFSNDNNFVLRSGLMFVLRHIDPDNIPATKGNEPILEIKPH